jgi:hypothetical protein
MSDQKLESVKDALPGFIEYLKTMPSFDESHTGVYGNNPWEQLVEEPELTIDGSLLSSMMADIIDESAAKYLKEHLPSKVLLEAWIETTEGELAYEEFQKSPEFDPENLPPLPASYQPSAWAQACEVYGPLVNAVLSAAYYENQRLLDVECPEEEEIEHEQDSSVCDGEYTAITSNEKMEKQEQQNLDLSDPPITPHDLLNDMIFIATISEGISHKICLYSSILSSQFYIELTIEASTMSDDFDDTIDYYYVPVAPIDFKSLAMESTSRGKMISVMEMSKGRKNIDHNEHGTGWCDHIFHPYA